MRSKVFDNTNDIKARKLIVNTFIKEILLYEKEIIITYYFSDNQERIKFTPEYFEDIEKQSRKETALAVKSIDGSYIFSARAPSKREKFTKFLPLLKLFIIITDRELKTFRRLR